MSGPLPSTIDTDLACVKCGYNLRGLAIKGVCPECSRPIVKSMPTGEPLSQPQIIALRRALVVVLTPSTGILLLVCGLVSLHLLGGFVAYQPVIDGFFPPIIVLLMATRCLGVFRMTDPAVLSRPYPHVPDQRPTIRATAVLLVVVSVLFAATHVPLSLSLTIRREHGEWLRIVRGAAAIVWALTSFVGGVALLFTAESIADRVRYAHLQLQIEKAEKHIRNAAFISLFLFLLGFANIGGAIILLFGPMLPWTTYLGLLWGLQRVLGKRSVKD